MHNFTPYSALGGGLLIGLAAVLLLLLHGRIAGISGILGGLLRPQRGDNSWRVAFIAGLVCAPLLAGFFIDLTALRNAAASAASSPGLLIISGLLVGVGTSLGSGCTSGHGVCGIARLSIRSIVATLVFILAGMITVFISRHLLGA